MGPRCLPRCPSPKPLGGLGGNTQDVLVNLMTDIPPNVLKLLADGKPDNRRRACVEVERLTRDFVAKKRNVAGFDGAKTLKGIVDNPSSSPLAKAGALVGLASVVLGVHPSVSSTNAQWHDMLQNVILPPIISSLNDPTDSRIRYYAVESLYNVTKVVRGPILVYFNEIFDALSRLVADNETGVNTSAQILDRLLKDVISVQTLPAPVENLGQSNVPPVGSLRQRYFNIERLMPLISERIHVINPNTRTFILQWLLTLEALPDVDLDEHLSDFLDGLLLYLADANPDVRQMTSSVLAKLAPPTKHLDKIVSILLPHITGGPAAETSLQWLAKIADQQNLAPLLPQLLPALAGPHKQTVQSIVGKLTDLDASHTSVLMKHVSHESMDVRLASLRLLETLTAQQDVVLDTKPILVLLSSDPNEGIVKHCLALVSRQTTSPDSIDSLLTGLMHAKITDKHRFSTIVRSLATKMDARQLLVHFSKLLQKQPLQEGGRVVQKLTNLIITAPEFASMRTLLVSNDLFEQLHPAWQTDAVSALTLAIFSTRYPLAWTTVMEIAEMEMTVEMLVQLDVLVQLFESPRFTHVRMQLVKTPRDANLVKTLYGMLALLPASSSAFTLLQTRLQTVATLIHLQ